MSTSTRSLTWVLAGISLLGMLLVAMTAVVAGAGRSVDAVLDAGVDHQAARELAGSEADRCFYAGPGRELCRWQLDGRL